MPSSTGGKQSLKQKISKVVDKFDQKTDVLWSSKKGGNVKSTIKTRSKEGTLLDTQELDKHLKDTRGKKSK
jgi:hypothetical protein